MMKFFKYVLVLTVTLVFSSAFFGAYATQAEVSVPEQSTQKADSESVGETTALKAPVISSVKGTVDGVRVKWNNVSGAAAYRVYRKTGSSAWKEIGTSQGTSYVDKNAASGKKHTYTVRCLDSKGNPVSEFNSGKSIKYVKSPVIKKFSNTATGTKITWTKCNGAAKYRILVLVNNKWKKLADVSSVSYTHKNLKTGKTYTYTVRCLDDKGKPVGAYDKNGESNVFITTPVISSVSNVNGGVKIKWGKLNGAAAYRVYRKTGDSKWTSIGNTKSTSYIDKNAVSGKKYTYTVRCLDSEGNLVSSNNSGKSIKYVKSPAIKKFSNTATGTKITWTKCSGAAKYRISYLDSSKKWKKLAEVTSTSYTHKNLKDGKTYTYTVRCLDSKGKLISGAATKKSNLFIAPPEISGVSAVNGGVLIKWSAVEGAEGYSVLRKTLEGSWTKLADITSGTSYTDTTAEPDKVYSYTLRCLSENGSYISYYIENTRYYVNGKPANGAVTVGKNTYYFNKGLFRNGLQTVNGKKYYYDSKGNLQKNGIVGSKADGWYYADKNGVIDFNYVNGIRYNGNNWIVSNGKATKASSKSDMVLFRAAKEVAKATDTTMTKKQKLRACFDYAKKAYDERNPRIPHYTGDDWPIIYANDMFVDGAGNCFSYAAAFAYMAKAIGYKEVYCCNSGGHGWAEIDGKIYDPEWSRHHSNYTYFGLDYDSIKNPNYKGAIAAGYSWMHVKI
ncbi:MAG: hypothetical protein IJ491_06100 [Clostridia bacterium]|nr:hypothetical protein [Clostridia bacterium]